MPLRNAIMAVVAEYETLTVRQLFYRLVSVGVIEKTEQTYKRVSDACVQMRLDGTLPYAKIVDGHRSRRKDALSGVSGVGKQRTVSRMSNNDTNNTKTPRITRTSVPIAHLRVGEVVREDTGDIAALAQSIRDLGLLHPIAIRPDGLILAGVRRYLAVSTLGWTEVPVTIMDVGGKGDRLGADMTQDQEHLEEGVDQNHVHSL